MAGTNLKSVYISYRRAAPFHARAVYQYLNQHGFDVFMDTKSLDSGALDAILPDQIAARAHFVVLLTPGALDRCAYPDDWLRLEIEHAIKFKRNVVPVIFEGFDLAAAKLLFAGKMAAFEQYKMLKVPDDYFDEAMERLRLRFLIVDVDAVIHPTPAGDKPVVAERKAQIEAQPLVAMSQLAAEHHVAQAYKHNNAGRFDEAIAAASEAIQHYPSYSAANNERGFAYYGKGSYERAVIEHDEAIRLDPDFAKAYNNRAFAHDAQGDHERAVADCTEAIRLEPNYAKAYNNRGAAYNARGELDLAVADFTEAIRLDPTFAVAFLYRSIVQRKLGKTAEADADEREAKRLDGK